MIGAIGRDAGRAWRGTLLEPVLIASALTLVFLALVVLEPRKFLLVCGVLMVGAALWMARRYPEGSLVTLIGAATLDAEGRIGQVGPATLTLYQVLLVVVLAYAAWRVWTKRSRLAGTPIDVPALLFVAVVAVSVIGALSPARSVVALVSLLSSILLVYLVTTIADSPAALVRLVLGVLGIAAVFAVLALLESRNIFFIGDPIRQWDGVILPHVTFADPNNLGSFLMVSALLGLPMATIVRGWWPKAIVVGGAGLCGLALLVSTSRGALGALLLGVVVLFLGARMHRFYKVAAVALVLLVALAVPDPAVIVDELTTVVLDDSTRTRFSMADSALGMARDNPFGVGADNYPLVYPRYRDSFTRWNLVESHTTPLTLIVEYGVLGLLAFTWILWRSVTRVWWVRRQAADPVIRALAAGALASGIGIIAQSFTYSFETNKFWWLSIAVGMAVYTAWQRTIAEEVA